MLIPKKSNKLPLTTDKYEDKEQYLDLGSVSGSAVIHVMHSSIKESTANPELRAMRLIHTGELWLIMWNISELKRNVRKE